MSINRLIEFLEENGYEAFNDGASHRVLRKTIGIDPAVCVSFYIEEMNTFSFRAYEYKWCSFDLKQMLLNSYVSLCSELRTLDHFQSFDNISIRNRITCTCLIRDEVKELIIRMMEDSTDEFLKRNGYSYAADREVFRKNTRDEYGRDSFPISFYKHNKLFSLEASDYSWPYDSLNLILLDAYVDLKILRNVFLESRMQENQVMTADSVLDAVVHLLVKRMTILDVQG